MENVRKHRDIKLVTTDKRINQLLSEPNYHSTKYFSENLLAIEMKKINVKMNKPVHLGLSILEISEKSIKTMQNYATCIHKALLFILKWKMFMKILQLMLKKDLIHQIMNLTDHYLQKNER